MEWKTGRDQAEAIRHDRLIRHPTGKIATGGERSQRVAVIALLPCDEAGSVGLPTLQEVLAREFERALHRLRPRRHEEGMRQAARLISQQQIGQGLGRLRGEEAGMNVTELACLPADGLGNPPITVSEAGHRRASRGVDHLAPVREGEQQTLAAHREVRLVRYRSM